MSACRVRTPSPLLALVLAGGLLAAAPASAVECNDLADDNPGVSESDSRAAISVCGFKLLVVSESGTFGNVLDSKSAVGTINGSSVKISTSASSLRNVNDTDQVQITINGVVAFNGLAQDIPDQGLRLLNLVNAINGRTLTQIETNRVATTTIVDIVSRRIQSVVRPRAPDREARSRAPAAASRDDRQQPFDTGIVGLSGGGGFDPDSAWVSFSNQWVANDRNVSDFNGTLSALVLGADRTVAKGRVLGIAGSLEIQSLDTDFNDGELLSAGISVIPYASMSFLDAAASIDALVSYAYLHSFSERNQSLGKVDADFGAHRVAAAISGNYFHTVGAFALTGRIGMLYALEYTQSFGESDGTEVEAVDVHLVQGTIGAELRYVEGPVEPYVRLGYANDLVRGGIDRSDDDRDEYRVDLGATFPYEQTGITADLAVNATLGRDDTKIYGAQATLLWVF